MFKNLKIGKLNHLLKIARPAKLGRSGGNWLLKIFGKILLPTKNLSKRNQKIAIYIALFIIVIMIPVIFYSLSHLSKAEAAWFDENFSFRQKINITNAGSAQTDFQVSMALDTSTLITAGKMQSNCNDIRITDTNGKVLPFWIETGTTGAGGRACNSTGTQIWTKVPSISTTGNTLYVYYGNPSAANAQDGNKVFELFDDFSGSTIDGGKWTQGTTNATSGTNWSVSGGNLNGGNQNRYLQSVKNFTGDYAVHGRSFTTTDNVNGFSVIGFWASTSNSFGILDHNNTSFYRNDASWVNFAFDGTGQWSRNVATVSGTTASYSRTGETSGFATATGITNSGISTEGVRLGARYDSGAFDQDYVATWDYVFVRKVAATMPLVASPTSEENGPGPVAYWKFDEGTGDTVHSSNVGGGTTSGTNIVVNPSFETNTTGWSAGFGGETLSRITTDAKIDTASIQVVGGANNQGIVSGYSHTVSASTTYTLSTWVKDTGGAIVLQVDEATSGVVYIQSQNATVGSGTGTWRRVSFTFTTSSTTGKLQINLYKSIAGSLTVWYDGIQLEQTTTRKPYCDGSNMGGVWQSANWTGTAHASTSTCSSPVILGTITGTTWQKEDQCISGKCLYFNGLSSGDKVDLGTSVKLNPTNFTVSAWVKTPDSSLTYNYIFSSDRDCCVTQNGISMFLQAGHLDGYIWNSTGTLISSQSTIPSNKWVYVTFSYDGSNMKLYIDGVLDKSQSYVGGVGTPATYNVSLGTMGFNQGTYTLKGYLDEPKLYNYARSAAQIKVDYNSRGGNGASVLGTTDATKNLSNGLVGYWKMDESSWNGTSGEVVDSSGNGNNGTAVSGAIASGSAKFGPGGQFDGVNDNVNIADSTSLRPSTAVSVGAWVKPGTATQAGFGILDKRWDDSVDPYNSYIIDVQGATYKYMFCVSNGTTGSQTCVYSTTSLTTNWTHVIGTYDGSSLKIYVNGVLEGTTAMTGAIGYTSQPLRIGCALAGSQCFNGQIDEARIYNRALSPAEVQQLYNFAPGPIAYYKMDEKSGTSVTDSSTYANNASFVGSPSWVSGKYGSGVSTNNTTSDYVNAPNVDIPNGDWTAMSWFKYPMATTGSSWHTLFRGNIIDHQAIVQRSDMQLGVYDNAGTGFHGCGFIMSTLSTGWHHISVVGTANVENFYIDGVYKCQSNFKSISDIKAIGNYQGGGQNWGQIDETKIYNYARTAGQIIEDMNAFHPAPGSPVGSALLNLKFDDGFGNYASNSGNMGASGNAGLYNMANPATTASGWAQNGRFGKALVFDGLNDYASVPTTTALDFSTGFTLSAWIYRSPTQLAPDSAIITKLSNSPYDGYGLLYSGTHTIGLYIDRAFRVSSTTVIPANTWTHVMGIWDGTNVKIYINGKLDASSTYSTAPTSSGQPFYVGKYSTNLARSFTGGIDEVKVYNSALTASQVKLEYNRGSSQVLGSLSDTSGLAGGSVASNSANAEYCVPGDTTSCAAPLGRWDFEEGKGMSANDTSGNANNGTIVAASYVSGKNGKGLSFNGSTTYVSAPDIDFTNAMTGETWVKFSSVATQQVLIRGGVSVIEFQLQMQGPGNINKFRIRLDSAGGSDIVDSTTLAVANQWYHLAWIYNGTDIKFYVNGIEETNYITNTGSGNIVDGNESTFFGAASSTPTFVVTGALDNIRIFNYARSQAQIAWDYNKGAPVGHWKMDECQGGTLNDSSGNGHLGTWNGITSGSITSPGTCSTASTAWGSNSGAGKINYAMTLDGTNDYIAADGVVNLATSSGSLSFGGWFKPSATTRGVPVSFHTSGGGNLNMIFWAQDGATNKFYYYDDSTSYVAITPTLSTGTWYHVFVTIDSSNNGKIYLNGVQSNTFTTSVRPLVAGKFSIGQEWDGGTPSDFFNGQVDEVKIFNYGLTANQVNVLYNNGAVNFGPNTGAP